MSKGQTLLIGAGFAAISALSCPGHGFAQTQAPKATAPAALTKNGYTEAKKSADAQYKADREACSSLAGNARDICVAEAKGKNDVARAEAAAAYENTPVTRENARVARARAAYGIAIEKCDDLAGNPKDVCVKEAKAALVRARADAKVDRIAGDARQGATARTQDAAREADAEKRAADYHVAIEKCAAYAGTAKEACVGDAKLRYGKT
jgi:membrane-associated HD superfamily phosphohydrolase